MTDELPPTNDDNLFDEFGFDSLNKPPDEDGEISEYETADSSELDSESNLLHLDNIAPDFEQDDLPVDEIESIDFDHPPATAFPVHDIPASEALQEDNLLSYDTGVPDWDTDTDIEPLPLQTNDELNFSAGTDSNVISPNIDEHTAYSTDQYDLHEPEYDEPPHNLDESDILSSTELLENADLHQTADTAYHVASISQSVTDADDQQVQTDDDDGDDPYGAIFGYEDESVDHDDDDHEDDPYGGIYGFEDGTPAHEVLEPQESAHFYEPDIDPVFLPPNEAAAQEPIIEDFETGDYVVEEFDEDAGVGRVIARSRSQRANDGTFLGLSVRQRVFLGLLLILNLAVWGGYLLIQNGILPTVG